MKKLLIVGLIVSLLMVGVVATASAIWEDRVEAGFTGKTGTVDITGTGLTVTLPNDIAPGYSEIFQVKITNAGDCSVDLTVVLGTIPTFLDITVLSTGTGVVPLNGIRIYNITVSMSTDVSGIWAQGQQVSFTITFLATNHVS